MHILPEPRTLGLLSLSLEPIVIFEPPTQNAKENLVSTEHNAATIPEPVAATGLSQDVQEALDLHRRAWSALQFHVQHTTDSVVTIPDTYVTFMVAVGRALASFPADRLVNYPDAVLLNTLYRHHQEQYDVLVSYDVTAKQLQIELDDPRTDAPARVSRSVFTFESVLGLLDRYQTDCSQDTQEVLLATVYAANQVLGRKVVVAEEAPKRQQLRLMTPSPSEPPPETAQIAAEMTMALWQSWGLDSQAVLGAVARAVEEALPVIEGDRIGSMIARQRLMVERLNDYVQLCGQSKAVVRLPSAYADYQSTLAALYVTFKDLGEEPILIFEELHGKYLTALAQQGKSDNWQAYYNSASSTLKLTTLLYPYASRAVEKHLPWNDARNAYIGLEPLLEAEPKDSRWPVRVTVNAPWDFEIERLILDRFERRYKEAGILDPISLQVLEGLDSMVEACLQQLKEGV